MQYKGRAYLARHNNKTLNVSETTWAAKTSPHFIKTDTNNLYTY